jgi:hypothetical protein
VIQENENQKHEATQENNEILRHDYFDTDMRSVPDWAEQFTAEESFAAWEANNEEQYKDLSYQEKCVIDAIRAQRGFMEENILTDALSLQRTIKLLKTQGIKTYFSSTAKHRKIIEMLHEMAKQVVELTAPEDEQSQQ